MGSALRRNASSPSRATNKYNLGDHGDCVLLLTPDTPLTASMQTYALLIKQLSVTVSRQPDEVTYVD